MEPFKKERDSYKENSSQLISTSLESNEILCIHCKRTKDNGIRCLGICVSESEY